MIQVVKGARKERAEKHWVYKHWSLWSSFRPDVTVTVDWALQANFHSSCSLVNTAGRTMDVSVGPWGAQPSVDVSHVAE